MKQIELFIEEIYHDVDGNKQEIEELKIEMKTHLLETVNELKAEGKSDQEAIDLAIERFGTEEDIRNVVGQLFQTQKLFAKHVLYAALFFLLLSLSGVLFLERASENNTHDLSNQGSTILEQLHNEPTLTETTQRELAQLVNESENVSTLRLYNLRNIQLDENGRGSVYEYVQHAAPVFQYEDNVHGPEWLYSVYPVAKHDSQWYVEMDVRFVESPLSSFILASFAIYLTLFTIWATINAYHHQRLHLGWFLAFAVLNVFGYLLYYLTGRRSAKKI